MNMKTLHVGMAVLACAIGLVGVMYQSAGLLLFGSAVAAFAVLLVVRSSKVPSPAAIWPWTQLEPTPSNGPSIPVGRLVALIGTWRADARERAMEQNVNPMPNAFVLMICASELEDVIKERIQ